MVKVKSSRGGFVDIQIIGEQEVIRRLLRQKKIIEGASDLGVIRAGGFVESEVKESIAGNRVETKSVDTGRFGNSIEFTKTARAEGVIKPKKVSYPNSSSTTEDVALFMEFGTSQRPFPRLHFTNTRLRTKSKVRDIIQTEINNVVR